MRKLTSLLVLLCMFVGTAWGSVVKLNSDSTPSALPGEARTFDGGHSQYHYTSPKFTAPDGFKTLRLTFMGNTNNGTPAGFPYAALAEFYLYDKNGDKVVLNSSVFSSNATETNEGSIGTLCDGVTEGAISKYDWYWHSSWSANVGAYHYLEINVTDIDADLTEFSFGYVTRQNDGSPTEIIVATGIDSEDVARQYVSYMLFNQYDLSTQAFRIKNSNITSEDLYMTIETPNSGDQNEGGIKILAKSENNNSQAFKFIQQTDGTFYIKSESGLYLNTLVSWGFNAVSEAVTDDSRSNFTIQYIGNDEFRIKGVKGFIGPNNNYQTDHPYELFSNHGADKQYIDWILEPYSSEYTVTYNYKVGDKVMLTDEYVVAAGDEYPALKSFYGVSIEEEKPTGTVSAAGTYNFTCTVDDSKFPFAYAADANSIETWQYIQMHSNNKRYIKYEPTYIAWADASLPALGKKDAYAWAFVGNPFVGFKMVNKAATTGKALKSTNSGNPSMVNFDEGTSFLIAASAVTGNAGYFCVKYPGGNCLNAQSGKIAHWGANDAGSTMLVNGVFEEITVQDYFADLQTLITTAETFVNENQANANKPGYYNLNVIQTKIEAAKDLTEESTMDEIDAAFVSLQNVLNAKEVCLPVAGKFYRIQNDNASGYLSSGTGTGRTQFVEGIGELSSSIFYFTGTKLVSYSTGLYLAESGSFVHYTNTVGEAAGTTFAFAKSPVLGKLSISFKDGNRSFYSNAVGSSNAASAGQNGEHYRFTVTEVEWLPVTMNKDAGFATLYSPVALSTYEYGSTSNHRVEAYVGKTLGEQFVMTRIDKEDGIIPANTPVVLKYVQGYDDTKNAVYLQVKASDKVFDGANELQGTFADANITGEAFVLAMPKVGEEVKRVGFYSAELTDGAFLNNGFKAYLPKPVGSSARFFVFDFGTETGIIETENGNVKTENVDIFDLSGRRVQKVQKGIFIVNGKKVIR